MPICTKFLLSATSPAQFPAPSVPEVAFLGRSNVGKSSLINALLGGSHARVSQTPGRTRAINFFALSPQPHRPPKLVFADLPGYGYAKVSKSITAEWSSFIDPYIASRETLALCVCLVDSNIPPQPSDAQLLHFLRSVNRSFVVVGTKADRLSGNARVKAKKKFCESLEIADLLLVSAQKGLGIKDLWSAIRSVAEEPE